MKIKIVFVILVLITSIITAIPTAVITSKSKDREFARTDRVYRDIIHMMSASYDSLANKSRVTISNSYSKTKNKKGVVIYTPTSTIEIDRMIDAIDQKIKMPVDSLIESEIADEELRPSFLDRLKNLFQ